MQRSKMVFTGCRWIPLKYLITESGVIRMQQKKNKMGGIIKVDKQMLLNKPEIFR